ncbi:hypothetical protein SAMN05421664_3657 [Chryseobacterium soldanellicola]|uniref:Uncharacterized protein n=1 Tax=Chryseobacterium soldanellicola TaxID=311333 RepID=A0A1H1GH47_9FLAO|nr:hypothetical protein SAMN05421664_3657 [Chryseobacterium soldanellicola]
MIIKFCLKKGNPNNFTLLINNLSKNFYGYWQIYNFYLICALFVLFYDLRNYIVRKIIKVNKNSPKIKNDIAKYYSF